MEDKTFIVTESVHDLLIEAGDLGPFGTVSLEGYLYAILNAWLKKSDLLNNETETGVLMVMNDELDKDKVEYYLPKYKDIIKQRLLDSMSGTSIKLFIPGDEHSSSGISHVTDRKVTEDMLHVLSLARKDEGPANKITTYDILAIILDLEKDKNSLVSHMAGEMGLSIEVFPRLTFSVKSVDWKSSMDPKESMNKFFDTLNRLSQEARKKYDKPGGKKIDTLKDAIAGWGSMMFGGIDPGKKDEGSGYLSKYSRCITSPEYVKTLDPHVPGADGEKSMSRLIEILSCRKKNNAIILGNPGCGKTALVEELAKQIHDGKIPALRDKQIYSLNLNNLVSGTKFRGEFEEKVQGIIDEVLENKNAIVFIDEIHNIVGSGSSSGNGDVANILKPVLARGEFQCIGSTTIEEYRKFIEKDGALKRRFQTVNVSEPSVPETIKILSQVSKKYATFHNVVYPKPVLELCVTLSDRYVTDRFFPDKAIEVLDLVGSVAKGIAIEEVDHQGIKDELDKIRQSKISKTMEGNIQEAKELKKKEDELSDKMNGPSHKEVTVDNVYKVISQMSGVPVDRISKTEVDKIRDMKANLETKVIGQGDAVSEVVSGIQRGLLGLRDISKPLSYLFVGPTGVGKTLICKEVATQFFGSPNSLIRFDMSEFSEAHQITKLTGATASYVGYDDSPGFEKVRRNPYSLVLFDEIEKAHPSIFNIFLQILDDGVVSLGNGQKVDFRHCIVVFTGNIGTREVDSDKGSIGFEQGNKRKKTTEIVMKAVKKVFRPEFLNRLSNVTVFNNLSTDDLAKIFDIELGKLKARLKEKSMTVKLGKGVKEKICSEVDLKYGARDLQRGIVGTIENGICNFMISDNYSGEKKFTVSLGKDGNVVVK